MASPHKTNKTKQNKTPETGHFSNTYNIITLAHISLTGFPHASRTVS